MDIFIFLFPMMFQAKKLKNESVEIILKKNGLVEVIDKDSIIPQKRFQITDKQDNIKLFGILKYGLKNKQGFSYNDSLNIVSALNVQISHSCKYPEF